MSDLCSTFVIVLAIYISFVCRRAAQIADQFCRHSFCRHSADNLSMICRRSADLLQMFHQICSFPTGGIFVIHGGIDGYSRLIVYLRCSNKNRAATVLSLLQDQSINIWDLPSRVRADDGGENVAVEGVLVHYRGGGGKSW